MGRKECCSKVGLNRGTWTAQEDNILTSYIQAHGEGQWRTLPERAGLKRCGKSCRLRWLNYLKPDVKRGNITPDEDDLILRLHRLLGNRWSLIAGRLPGRTDNEIKNYWNTKLAKKAYPSSSPQQPIYKGPVINTTTKVLKPVPFKATRPVNCPEFPLINSNLPSLRENYDVHRNEINPVNLDDFDLGLCDFEINNGDNPFPASNCVSSMEAFLMEECINNVNGGRDEDEHNKNYLDMEGLDMFVNTDQRP